jgi:arylsulfatase A-like enzyme
VICTTDHGLPFPRAKATLYDRGLGVLLMLRGPGGLWGGRVIDAPVSHLDLFPTVCELAGIEPPARLDGTSLLPLVRGEVARLHEATFGEITYHAAYEPQRSIRTERFKYIRRFGDHAGPVLPNCDDGPTKDTLIAAGRPEWEAEPEQLYDLVLDPNEMRNLIGDPRLDGVASELREAGWRRPTIPCWTGRSRCRRGRGRTRRTRSRRPSRRPSLPADASARQGFGRVGGRPWRR